MKTAAEMKKACLKIAWEQLETAKKNRGAHGNTDPFQAGGWYCRQKEAEAIAEKIEALVVEEEEHGEHIDDADLLEILKAGRRIVDITRELRDR